LVSVDQQAPAGAPDNRRLCVWCGRSWPCPPRGPTERADQASRRPWRESWTARHDLNRLPALPGWRADPGAAVGRRWIPRNRGPFD